MNERIDEDLPENDAELLLPFYVNGTLSEAQTQMVERWLHEHAGAAEHLARVSEEIDLTRADAESLGVPPRRVLDSLMAEIGASPDGSRPESFVERVWAWLSPRHALAGAAALALVVVAQTGYIAFSSPQTPAQFQTATGQSEGFAGPSALVVFAPDTATSAVAARLSELGLTVVDGPKPGGIFVVGAPDSEDGRAALAELGRTAGLTSFFQMR